MRQLQTKGKKGLVFLHILQHQSTLVILSISLFGMNGMIQHLKTTRI